MDTVGRLSFCFLETVLEYGHRFRWSLSPISYMITRDQIVMQAPLLRTERAEKRMQYNMLVDVSKKNLDVAIHGESTARRMANDEKGIQEIVAWMKERQPALIILEVTGRIQRQLCS